MNFRRGLFRLWLVLSLAWIGLIAYTERGVFCDTYKPYTAEEKKKMSEVTPADREACRARGENPCSPSFIPFLDIRHDCSLAPSDGYLRAWSGIQSTAEQALWPPAIAFLVGWLLIWIGDGFRRRTP